MPGVALKASNCWSMFDLSTNEWSTLRTECTFQTCSQIMHCKYMLQQTEFVTQNPQNIIRITHKKNNFYQTTKLIPSQNRPLDSSAMHQAHRLSSLQLCTDTDWMTETKHNIWKNLRKLIFFYSCDHTMKKSNKTPLKLIKGIKGNVKSWSNRDKKTPPIQGEVTWSKYLVYEFVNDIPQPLVWKLQHDRLLSTWYTITHS